MSIRNLDSILHPSSIAVVGASDRIETPGGRVLSRIVAGGFAGPVWPVNPRRRTVQGLPCFASAVDLPEPPSLAVIAAPPDAVPTAIAELGARGCRVAVVLTAVGSRRQAMLDAARPHLLRVIGPASDGVILPWAKLHASLAPPTASPGSVALVSQSGTIAAALLDRAAEHGIGFSHVVALGSMADADAGDYLDLLAGDGRTRAILLYLESVPQPRKFLSAARAAARLKPVIAVKAGRSPQAAEAAASHTGALAGADDVVDAALARAGVLRVRGLSELFAAAETVARFRPMTRARLGIVTNSGGAGVLALDSLAAGGGTLAPLGADANPKDIGGDATPARYLAALETVADDGEVDAVLAMHCPTADAPPEETARAVAGLVEKGTLRGKPVLACWMGGVAARAGRAVLRERGIATYDAPAAAVAAVAHLTAWGRAQAALLLVPDRADAALGTAPADARARVAAIFAAAAGEGRRVLTLPEAQAVLVAYGLPAPELRVARSAEEVAEAAAGMLSAAGSVAVKLLSRDVAHKFAIGGVVLNVASPPEAEAAARTILERTRVAAPLAGIDGFAVQPMVRSQGLELILGIGRDPIFGPVILFGAGGVSVERIRDTALALPPLDAGLAAELVARTRVGRFFAASSGAKVDTVALNGALVALSHLIEDFPCLRAVDVNPLVADASGVIALDAHVEIDPEDLARPRPNPDLVIRPYPAEWRRRHGQFELRPIRPTDALLYPEFLGRTDPEHLRLRFLAPRRNFSDDFALRMTQLDYDREMAFVALASGGELAGVARIACDPDRRVGEYALLVRSDKQGQGLGGALMRLLIDYARADGIERLEGMILGENTGMRALVERLGFSCAPDPDDPGVVLSRLPL